MAYSNYNLNNRISYIISQIQNVISNILPNVALKNEVNTFTENNSFENVTITGLLTQSPAPNAIINASTSGTCRVYVINEGIFKQYMFIFNVANGNVVYTLPIPATVAVARDTLLAQSLPVGTHGTIITTLTTITIPSCVNLTGFMVFYGT
jgi:hypothetical protein